MSVMRFCWPALLLSIPAPGRLRGEEVAVWERRRHGCQHGGRSGRWVAGWFLGWLSELGARARCCQTLPALLSVEDWFKALASAHRGHVHRKLFFGLYDVDRWSVRFAGTGVSVAAVVGAHWHVAALPSAVVG